MKHKELENISQAGVKGESKIDTFGSQSVLGCSLEWLSLTLGNPWTPGKQERALKPKIHGHPSSLLATPQWDKHRSCHAFHLKSTLLWDVCSEVVAVVYQLHVTFNSQYKSSNHAWLNRLWDSCQDRDHKRPTERLGNFILQSKYQISTTQGFFCVFFFLIQRRGKETSLFLSEILYFKIISPSFPVFGAFTEGHQIRDLWYGSSHKQEFFTRVRKGFQ